LYGRGLVAGDEATHDDVFKQHHLKRSQQWVTVKHCSHIQHLHDAKKVKVVPQAQRSQGWQVIKVKK